MQGLNSDKMLYIKENLKSSVQEVSLTKNILKNVFIDRVKTHIIYTSRQMYGGHTVETKNQFKNHLVIPSFL